MRSGTAGIWEEHFGSLLAYIDIIMERYNYGDIACAQQPNPHSPTSNLGDIAGVNGQNSKGMCQGGI